MHFGKGHCSTYSAMHTKIFGVEVIDMLMTLLIILLFQSWVDSFGGAKISSGLDYAMPLNVKEAHIIYIIKAILMIVILNTCSTAFYLQF